MTAPGDSHQIHSKIRVGTLPTRGQLPENPARLRRAPLADTEGRTSAEIG